LSFNDQGIVFADADHWVKVRLWAKTGWSNVETVGRSDGRRPGGGGRGEVCLGEG
jgi:hypothetical protein